MRTTLLLLTATLLSAAEPPVIKLTAPAEINSLHEAIKLRFQDRATFGISRMGGPPRQHGRVFTSENAVEQAILDQFKMNKMEVIAYLVGRQAKMQIGGAPRTGLQGPVLFTRSTKTQPDQQDMLAKGIDALANVREGYDTKSGDWNVAIRPLRATNETCVQCHSDTTPKLGDALGVAMYAYRSVILN